MYTSPMLNTHQQVEFLIAGLHANGATTPALASDPVDTLAHAAYADDLSGLEQDSPGHEFIDATLGRWAKTGNLKFIGELVRFAKHRDGSSNAIGESLYAMDILNAAAISDPAFAGILRNFGYDAAKPAHGSFPEAMTIDELSDGPEWIPDLDNAPAMLIAADLETMRRSGLGFIELPVSGSIGQASALAANCRCDRGAVVLEFDFVPGSGSWAPGLRMSLGVAAELAADLAQMVDEMTLPASEGYAWYDAEDGTSSILRAEGRKTAALFSDKARFPGTRDTREIGSVQDESSEFPDTDVPFVATFGNFKLARSRDLASAKFTLAQRVREYLAAPAE